MLMHCSSVILSIRMCAGICECGANARVHNNKINSKAYHPNQRDSITLDRPPPQVDQAEWSNHHSASCQETDDLYA